jgi:RHH-type rel operon transcriptional repressor/antitoxin RelB
MTTIQIPAEIESQIDALADRTGESKDDLVREALLAYLEDMDDVAIAKEHLLHPDDTLSLDEMKKSLGLDEEHDR